MLDCVLALLPPHSLVVICVKVFFDVSNICSLFPDLEVAVDAGAGVGAGVMQWSSNRPSVVYIEVMYQLMASGHALESS